MKLNSFFSGLAWTFGGLAVALACSDSFSDSPSLGRGSDSGTGGAGGMGVGGTGPSGDSGSGGSDGGFGGEIEDPVEFDLPHAGRDFVFVSSPESDSVAIIDARTLKIQSVEAGDQPQFLQTLNGRDEAIVLNVNSSDATIIRQSGAKFVTSRVELQPGANAIAVAPDGNHAVVYRDASKAGGGDSGNFQSVDVLRLADGEDRAIGLTVGFLPSAVHFSSDSQRAFVVTQGGVSVVELDNLGMDGAVAAPISIGNSPGHDPVDVSVTPSGRHAVARFDDSGIIYLLDLETEELTSIDLTLLARGDVVRAAAAGAGGMAGEGGAGGSAGSGAMAGEGGAGGSGGSVDPVNAITDLDVAPDGSFAIAVLRNSHHMLKIPIPEGFDDPSRVGISQFPERFFGSVQIAPDGGSALLYTTVDLAHEHVTLVDLAGDNEAKTVDVRKAVRRVAFVDDGQTALVIHEKLPGDPNEPGTDPDTKIDRSYGYSLIRMDSGFSKLETTPAEIGPFARVPGGSHLFLLFEPNAGSFHVQRVRLQNLQVTSFRLGSLPVSVGAIPNETLTSVFVGQSHEDGRISFIDWDSGAVRTVTGFELNGGIRD